MTDFAKVVALPVAVLVAMTSACGAGQTWTGTISDDTCRDAHVEDEHSAAKTDQQCTLECVKSGAKYVFISDGKVYTIENRNDPDLTKFAGDTVFQLTGKLKGDSITVSKLELREKQ